MAENKHLEDVLRDIIPGKESSIDILRDTDGVKKLVISNPPIEPIRAESDARCHTFHSIETFRKYLARYGGMDTVILADITQPVITAILAEMADKGRELVCYTPQVHPLMRPWVEAVKARMMTIGTFAQIVMENRKSVVQPNALALMLQQIRISKHTEINAGVGAESINGVMVTTKIQGQEGTMVVSLPDAVTVRAPIFVDMEPIEVEFDLTVAEREGQVVISVTSADLITKQDDFIEDIVGSLMEDGDITASVVGLGKPYYENWRYIR